MQFSILLQYRRLQKANKLTTWLDLDLKSNLYLQNQIRKLTIVSFSSRLFYDKSADEWESGGYFNSDIFCLIGITCRNSVKKIFIEPERKKSASGRRLREKKVLIIEPKTTEEKKKNSRTTSEIEWNLILRSNYGNWGRNNRGIENNWVNYGCGVSY